MQFFLLTNNDSRRNGLKEILGFRPKDIRLYEQAFTHKSIVANENNSNQTDNERLEFLGDAVLGAIIAEYFFQKFPNQDEGYLTKMRSKMVSRQFLNELSIKIGLDTFLETKADLNHAPSILGNAFEALVGAIYLDKGYKVTKKFVIEKVIAEYINMDKLIKREFDYKGKLTEWCQSHKYELKYNFIEVRAEDKKRFKCQLLINSQLRSVALGKSKKKASQKAAEVFFQNKEA